MGPQIPGFQETLFSKGGEQQQYMGYKKRCSEDNQQCKHLGCVLVFGKWYYTKILFFSNK
ncbi:hypothetical protein DF182_24160 [Chitinophaga flava]|uniref:Uncharacterized protein n=1 Tax=Chitinophaga flava TaxID=2259036 RepID=A0A365XUA5_9BACT|nr:hypothetical protein DF182_24160 [Chitinophaga flava]